MTPLLVGLVLTAALLHAAWNALAKSGGQPEYSIAAYQVAGGVLCLLALPFVPTPAPESWPMIAASVAVHNVYYLTLSQAYRAADLSQVYPLFRGLAPVLVTLAAAAFADEWVGPGVLAGIVIVSAGIVSLAFLGHRLDRISPRAWFWGLTTSVLIATYTIVDGLGVRASGNSLSYILWLYVFEGVPIGMVLLLTRRAPWFTFMRANPGRIMAGAVASSAAYGLVIFAMGLGAMGVVSSLRETSVVFAAIIGAWMLKEPFGKRRIQAALVVAAGILAMRLLS